MSVLIPQDSAYGKEMWKWENFEGTSHPSDPTIKGMKARDHREYPKMMYRVTKGGDLPEFDQVVVHSASDQDLQSRSGFVDTQTDALHRYERDQKELAMLAANRAYQDRNMSDAAKAEIRAFEETSSRHVAEIPETPVKRRPGRPRRTE
jgi:hypothetical protein